MPSDRTRDSFKGEVPRLLGERGLSQHRLALQAGLDPGFLARVLAGKKPASHNVVVAVSRALGLPPDYFAEARLEEATKVLSANPILLDDVYDHLKLKRGASPTRVAVTSARQAIQEPDDQWISPLGVLGSRDPTDPSLARLGAAVLRRYEQDDQFRRAVDEQFAEIERLSSWLMLGSQRAAPRDKS